MTNVYVLLVVYPGACTETWVRCFTDKQKAHKAAVDVVLQYKEEVSDLYLKGIEQALAREDFVKVLGDYNDWSMNQYDGEVPLISVESDRIELAP